MPLVRARRSTRRPAARARPARRTGMMRPYRSIRYNKVPSFVETYAQVDTIPSQAGGVLGTAFNLIPQNPQYAALYNQYRINWVQYTIMPQWDSFDPNNAAVITAPRIAFSIQDTASDALVLPASENDVLLDNGVKVRMLTRPVKIKHKPVPQVGVALAAGGFASISRKGSWLDMSSPNVPHGWVNYWITNGGPAIAFKVYVKVSFSLRDPK